MEMASIFLIWWNFAADVEDFITITELMRMTLHATVMSTSPPGLQGLTASHHDSVGIVHYKENLMKP